MNQRQAAKDAHGQHSGVHDGSAGAYASLR